MQKNKLIISSNQEKTLSKTQAKFNKLVQEIEDLKVKKENFLAQIKEVEIKMHKQVIPLATENTEKCIEILFRVDKAMDEFKMNKREKEALAQFITTHLDEIIPVVEKIGMDSSKLKALYEKYEEISYDEAKEGDKDMMKDMFKNIFGFDIDPDKMDDEEYLQDRARAYAEQNGFGAPKEKKKTKKQLEAEAKEKEAEDKIKKDARTIYTQLAKKLHPDTEQDEIIRLQKTELMKRVTNAYSDNDLFELLQIQMEVEQLDASSLAEVSDDLMSSYVKVLQKQVNELRVEINIEIKQNPIYQEFFDYKEKFQESRLRKKVKELKDALVHFKMLENMCNHKITFKQFAKELIEEYEEVDDDFFSGFDFFGR